MKPEGNCASAPPRRGDLDSLVGKQLRVLDGAGGRTVMGEGECIGYCQAPTLLIRAADGSISHHSTELPIEVSEWRRL